MRYGCRWVVMLFAAAVAEAAFAQTELPPSNVLRSPSPAPTAPGAAPAATSPATTTPPADAPRKDEAPRATDSASGPALLSPPGSTAQTPSPAPTPWAIPGTPTQQVGPPTPPVASAGSPPAKGEASAQNSTTSAGETASQTEIAAKRAELAQRIAAAERALEAAQQASADGSAPSSRQLRELELLRQWDVVLGQRQAASERNEEMTATAKDLAEKLASLKQGSPPSSRTSPFLWLDRMQSELESQRARKEGFETAVENAAESVALAKKNWETKERARRQAKEAAQSAHADGTADERAASQQLAELESSVAEGQLRLREAEEANEKLAMANYEKRVGLLEQRIAWLSQHASFTSKDLDEQLADLARQQTDIRQSCEAAQVRLDQAETRWIEARGRLAPGVKPQFAQNEELEARRLAREACQQELAVLNRRLERLLGAGSLWKQRYEVHARTATAEQAAAWQKEAEQQLTRLGKESRLAEQKAAETRADLATLEQKTRAVEKNRPEAVPHLREQAARLQEIIQARDSEIASIAAQKRLCEKLLGDLRGDAPTASWQTRLNTGLGYAAAIWNYEITSVDDKPITVRKILGGCVLLILGYFLSRVLSRWFAARVLPRLRVHESATKALETVAFYVLVCTFSMFALRIVNVPLTAFTVVGGALAIGVGFGSQNIANNFISGLILLAERPVRVGDTIELNGLKGLVESIGARSTRVKTDNNLEIIMPNSTLLESNVINWTLTDDRVRKTLSVGVAYGSPARKVAEILERVACEQPDILRDPPPSVVFSAFGDNALQFDLVYWIHLRSPKSRGNLESAMRYLIDELFTAEGIVMAFPQRDIHLNSAQPIQVAILPSLAAAEDAPHELRRAA